MIKSRSRKLSMVLLVAFMMTTVLPVSAWAATSKFTDIPNDHWAKQQLVRMSARGVLSGYGDGTVKPNNTVTQFEAVIMATGIMGLREKADSVATGTYLPVTVPNWDGSFELAVVAYQAGLIDASDFTHDKEATREWVAKLLVKILGQEDKVSSAAGEYLSFSDSGSISSQYLNYVKVANNLKLLSGYEDGTFKPKNKVSRAEMAAFLARAENQMSVSANNVLVGSVTAISGINLEITAQDGTKKNVYSTTNSAMYNLNGKEMAATQLSLGTPVFLIYNGSLLEYLEVRDGSSVPVITTTTVKGTLVKVMPDKNTIIVSGSDNALSTIVIDNNTGITRENTTLALTINDLSANDQVKVTVDSKQVAQKIVVVNKGNSYTLGGTVYDIDVYNNLITMNQTDGLKSYKMASNITVSVAGMLSATTSNLKAGDKASFEIKNNEMTAIAVSGSSDQYAGQATILQINTADKFINYKTNGGDLKANYYNNFTRITFNGETGKISDLQVNDSVTLDIADNVIKSIDVKSRKLSEGYKGTVYAIDTANSIITFIDSDNNMKTYPVSTSATITLYDKTSYLSSIKKDMAIEVNIANGIITNIRANNRIEGTVVAVNTNSNYIEILPDGASTTTTYNVSSSVYVNKFNTSGTKLNVVKIGDQVNVKVENNKVTDIDVTSKIEYTVTKTYGTTSSRVQVMETNNNNYLKELYIYSEVDLIINGSNSSKVGDLKVNDRLIATYKGDNLTRVETSTQIAGTIEGLNPTLKLVTVRGYDGKQYKYNFDITSYVSMNGYTYNDFSRLAVGNKVAISEGADKGRCFGVLTETKAKIGLMHADLTTVLMQESSSTSWIEYKMASDIYMHKGTTILKRADFPLNTQVTFYHDNNVVYEITK